jgi:DNA replication protein DnaC
MKVWQVRADAVTHRALKEEAGANMKTSSIRDVLSLGFVNKRETLIISGSINSDMNALAGALGMKAEREGKSVITVNAGMLHGKLAESGEGGLSAAKLAGIAESELLIIENFGMRKLAPSDAKVITQLVTGRINRSSTIITSGCQLGEWAPLLRASPEGKSLLSSLMIHAKQVVIGSKEEVAKKGLHRKR